MYGVLKAKTRRVVLKQLELVHFLVATYPSILDVAVALPPWSLQSTILRHFKQPRYHVLESRSRGK